MRGRGRGEGEAVCKAAEGLAQDASPDKSRCVAGHVAEPQQRALVLHFGTGPPAKDGHVPCSQRSRGVRGGKRGGLEAKEGLEDLEEAAGGQRGKLAECAGAHAASTTTRVGAAPLSREDVA